MSESNYSDVCKVPDEVLVAACCRRYGLDIESVFLSSPPLSGDAWGLMPLDDARLAVFCADVCGHGIEVAPYAHLVGLILGEADLPKGCPADTLAILNQRLYALLPRGRFVAIWYGVINIETDTITWSCSTFLPQLLAAGGARFELLPGAGLPLGFLASATFDTHVRPFAPGARLILYSDALTETPLPPEAVFDTDGLRTFVDTLPDAASARQVNKALIDQLDLGVHRLIDDLTVVSLFRAP
jgi:sigma-B regulation protein RsbU (phosphoserine phosphatase)